METVRLRFECFSDACKYIIARVPISYMVNELLSRDVSIFGDSKESSFYVCIVSLKTIWGVDDEDDDEHADQCWQDFKAHLVKRGGVIVKDEDGNEIVPELYEIKTTNKPQAFNPDDVLPPGAYEIKFTNERPASNLPKKESVMASLKKPQEKKGTTYDSKDVSPNLFRGL